ncbi:sensor histidine kinase [Pseudomonas sp. UW4]|uniref:ATP-binding protein n=1 Tax=Pseudomonas sp. UW4 TaxID=1207075 RepID=UPI00029CF1E9|nr:sensor histidine kinase [Pseudomonas sp. UW4]AFY21382.1 histidine kinase [Pseudomonas sp. UW4]
MENGRQLRSDGSVLHFKVSSALKTLIGRDLITDEFVAIFELVKNSFDARATRVDILFDQGRVYIADNGKGMSFDDIRDKWLFVAYSAKGDGTEDLDYREQINSSKSYAGSKGVGRFSCDRLGRTLFMQTKTALASQFEIVEVEWDLFEGNSKDEIATIPLFHSTRAAIEVPKSLSWFEFGTILEVGELREVWSREKYLKLRSALAKLINPFGGGDGFEINLTVPEEEKGDISVLSDLKSGDEVNPLYLVNGPIQNFIFETLKDKTTHLQVEISDGGSYITSILTDRSEMIYKVREKNPYPLLKEASFNSNLYYLNRSAKQTFSRRMGVPSVRFGSIFLFKNGFRVFPIGEEGVDTFGIDRRKQQGYARFLGTRDVIGRIDIIGVDDRFRESTSRDQGLIDTPAYRQLVDCFEDKCFKRLERYVVGVNWKDALDLDVEDTSRIRGEAASARITAIVAQLAGGEGVELLDFSRELIRILNERSDDFKESLAGLRTLAEKSGDKNLLEELDAASYRYNELQRAEAAARDIADRERTARRDAERNAAESAQRADAATKSYEEERKRNLFLTSISNLDKDTIEILHHQIIIHASAVNEIINGQFDRLRHDRDFSIDDVKVALENISFQNRKILSIARFATKANFRMESETITDDLVSYIEQYINQVAPMLAETGISISVINNAKSLVRTFKPIEISIMIDNFISNAGRAEADKIVFSLRQISVKELQINAVDNGRGFDAGIVDLNRLFEKGYSTSTGSGLGLYHVQQIIDSLGGSIAAERGGSGAEFVLRIKG